ncbi:alpha/beta fold hydrolase [Trinickia violacea]|uniref:Alpha/beta fold hydrolase n=1 Tax=Trinickia violacea TaxID=2571746 RepID=A0A4P8IRQ0_9BURK|nr:alpha/beta fold hydrolase [Trinickia violacea]QCP50395.1 alpha/beta fold hydrolase [Trinickia violacea]
MTSRFTGFDGVKLAADVGGDPADPAVLLLPAFGQTRAAWARAARALIAAGRFVVTVDLRGHGESDWSPDGSYELGDIAQDVAAVIAQMPSQPAVVGAGLGGLAALTAIGEHAGPDPIASALVLIDAAPRMAPKGLDRITALMTVDIPGFSSVEEAAAVVAEHLSNRERLDIGEVQRHLRRADDGRLRWHIDPAYQGFKADAAMRRAAQRRLTAAAATLDIPILFVHGEASAKIDQASIDAFRELVPHAEFIDIAGVGDMIIADRNDAFDSAILDFLERVVPRRASRPQGGVTARMLRDAMGCFATGVTVITTTGVNGEPVGFTANSFTSVSLEPPLVLFCVKRESASVAALRACGAFAVNILHIGQQAVSTRFAGKTGDRFAETEWDEWDHGVPIILDAMGNFECLIREIHDGGDHLIVVGSVKRVNFDPARDPLLFMQGKYRRVHVTREELN